MADYNLKVAQFLVSTKNAIILDTRTQEEFCQGHLCGARLVLTPAPPLSEYDIQQFEYLLKKSLKYVCPTHPIIVYCKLGKRATIAQVLLNNAGFKNVVVLGGVAIRPLNKIFTNQERNPYFKVCKCHEVR